MADLFSGDGKDPKFLAIRDKGYFSDIRGECQRLWLKFEPFAETDFVCEFSRQFIPRFWEMYLMVRLADKHGDPAPKSRSQGPDFKFGRDPSVWVEATTAERGSGQDAVPDISQGGKDEDTVPFQALALRVTSRLAEKVDANNARRHGENCPYVVAINLPFPEAWICSDPPLSAQACLGLSSLYLVKTPDEQWQRVAGMRHKIPKRGTGCEVKTTCFLDGCYRHVSALIVANVNPFSSCYTDPAFELLHNPTACNPLPHDWLRIGTEYWVDDNSLRCKEFRAS